MGEIVAQLIAESTIPLVPFTSAEPDPNREGNRNDSQSSDESVRAYVGTQTAVHTVVSQKGSYVDEDIYDYLPNVEEEGNYPIETLSQMRCGCCGRKAVICDFCHKPKRGLLNSEGNHVCANCKDEWFKSCANCGKDYSIKFPGKLCRSCYRNRPKF